MINKKIGLCRREILKGTVKNPEEMGKLFMTEGDLKSAIRSMMRKAWTSSTRRIFIEKVRFPDTSSSRGKWLVKCDECGDVMPLSAKRYGLKKDGTPNKREKLVYEVDHLESLTLIDIEKDLANYVQALFYGEMRILCRYPCHEERTKKQKAKK